MQSWRDGGGFDLELVEARPGFALLRVTGRGASQAFAGEPGGHRWQRVPPTEKRGRLQTSTITVAVLTEPTAQELTLNERDLEWRTCRGSGAGGQHRNVTDSAVTVVHRPTGTSVRCEGERSQQKNRATALAVLRARLAQAAGASRSRAEASLRKAQVGSGQRGDKVRTIRCQDGVVTCHRTGRKLQLDRYLRGCLEELAGD